LKAAAITCLCLILVACGDAGSPAETSVTSEMLLRLKEASAAHAGRSAEALTADAQALALGAELYRAYCAACHRADGSGARGVTDLTRGRYDYGVSSAAILATIRDGRRSEMPDFGDRYNEFGVGQLVNYVRSLAGDGELSQNQAAGRESFMQACAACPGEDGRGQVQTGASDLTDGYWQYGESLTSIRSVITNGVVAECPTRAGRLSLAEMTLLTAYVMTVIADR
jgi:cytochrome c oxidase cbb3-type subunit 3